ncbi:MAG: urate hydroxylase PuuD [Gammaproteobacteria bacterium]|nr:MAG: urate hydroxylase PuuD [Gammaproteobacteria bacterium]
MNPLTSILGTIISGFVLAIIIILALGTSGLNLWSLEVWAHVLAGITWIGLLYYFNFVQVPAVGEALGDEGGPGPAAINKYVAPRALLWFRWGAVATWLTGAAALEQLYTGEGSGFVKAFTLQDPLTIIGIGAWLGTIMLFNVWVLIWPNQKKILGIVEASADEIAGAKKVALMASRTNTLLSIPMLMCMVGHGHGLPF